MDKENLMLIFMCGFITLFIGAVVHGMGFLTSYESCLEKEDRVPQFKDGEYYICKKIPPVYTSNQGNRIISP